MARRWHCTVTFERPETQPPRTTRDINVVAASAGATAMKAFAQAKKAGGAIVGYTSVLMLVEKGDEAPSDKPPMSNERRQVVRDRLLKARWRQHEASAAVPQNAQEGRDRNDLAVENDLSP